MMKTLADLLIVTVGLITVGAIVFTVGAIPALTLSIGFINVLNFLQ